MELINKFAKNLKKGNFSFVRCVPLMEWLHPWLYQCQQGNKEIFGYDIYWHFHLDTLNYNVYGINDEYGWHKDASGMQHNMILNLLVC